jgi:hypothetical protein
MGKFILNLLVNNTFYNTLINESAGLESGILISWYSKKSIQV